MGIIIKINPPRWSWRFLPKKIRYNLVIGSIRDNMSFFGSDLSDITDEELADGVANFAKMISKASPTVKDAVEAFQKLARAASRIGEKGDLLKGPWKDKEGR